MNPLMPLLSEWSGKIKQITGTSSVMNDAGKRSEEKWLKKVHIRKDEVAQKLSTEVESMFFLVEKCINHQVVIIANLPLFFFLFFSISLVMKSWLFLLSWQ